MAQVTVETSKEVVILHTCTHTYVLGPDCPPALSSCGNPQLLPNSLRVPVGLGWHQGERSIGDGNIGLNLIPPALKFTENLTLVTTYQYAIQWSQSRTGPLEAPVWAPYLEKFLRWAFLGSWGLWEEYPGETSPSWLPTSRETPEEALVVPGVGRAGSTHPCLCVPPRWTDRFPQARQGGWTLSSKTV